jgi:cytochrome c biogenesis protein CcmG/thiol:disulfide interchange protein DsbE
MRRALAFAPLAALALLVLIGGVLLLRGPERERFSSGDSLRPAPAYSLERLGGGAPVVSEDMRGRVHVINLFASWCTPCRAEHEHLMALRAEGVAIVGVAYKDRPQASAAFLDELGNPFAAVGLDPEGRFALELGTTGIPETFVIGADGRIIAIHRGPLTDDVVEDVIQPALAAGAG